MRIASLFLIGATASLFTFRHADAAVIAYHDATFSNFSTTGTNANQFVATFDVNVDGSKAGTGSILSNDFSGGQFNGNLFSAIQQTPAGVGNDPLLRLGLTENTGGDSPALGADVSVSFTLLPAYKSIGLSMSSNGAIWGVNRLDDLTFTGSSATIFDNDPVAGGMAGGLTVAAGPVASAFTNGNDLNFFSQNFDNANGFLTGTHNLNWGMDIVAGTALQFRYRTPGLVTNVQSEFLVFGLLAVLVVPEPSTLSLAMLGLFPLGLVRRRRVGRATIT